MDDAKKTKAKLVEEIHELRAELDNLRTTDKRRTSQRKQRITELLESYIKLTAGLSLGRIAHTTLEFLRDQFEIRHSSIALLDPDHAGFSLLTTYHPDTTRFERGTYLPFRATVLSEMIREKRATYRPDLAAARSGYAVDAKLLAAGIRSDLIVPLWVEGKCLGTLNVGSEQIDGFTEEEREFIPLLAPSLAQFLQHAVLFDSLQEREGRFRAVFNDAGIGIALVDSEGHPVHSNPALQRMLGYSGEELSRMVFTEFTYPDDAENDMQLYLELMAGKRDSYKMEKRYYCKEGELIYANLTVTLIRDADGQPEFAVAMVEDITERKRAEGALERSEKKYRELVELAQEGIWLIDKEGITTFVNPAMSKMLGYTVEEMLNKHLFSFMDDQGIEISKANIKRRQKGIKEQHDFEFMSKDGKRIYTTLATAPIIDDDGIYTGAIAGVIDITERRRAEDALSRSQADLATRNQSLAAVNSIADRVYRSLDLRTVAQEAVDAMVRYSQSPSVAFFLLNEQARCLELLHSFGFSEEARREGSRLPLQGSLSGVAIALKNVVVSKHMESDDRLEPETKKTLLKQGYRAAISVPLLFQNQVLGVMNLIFRESRAFDSEERQTLLSIGKTIGLAVANAKHVAQLEAEMIERLRAEEALFEEKDRAQTTLQSIGDGVITTDMAGVIEYLNPVAEQLTGLSTDEARGQPLGEVLTVVRECNREPVQDPVRRCLENGEIVSFDEHILLIRGDDNEFAVDLTAAPIRSHGGGINGAVLVLHDITAMWDMAQQLSYQATHDALTGLHNRREFEQRLEDALKNARINDRIHTLCFVDLDQFKIVNDTCGHVAGDELLRQVSDLFRAHVRESDTIGRLGGDEFGVLLDSCAIDQASAICEKLRDAVEAFRFTWDGKHFEVGVSIGLVPITRHSRSVTELLSSADAACYVAKDLGRNRLYVYRTGDDAVITHHGAMQWVHRINQALEENRFRLYCQRIVPLQNSGAAKRYEFLIRMLDEDGHIILPKTFLPAAERYYLMPAIDRWVIRNMFALLKDIPQAPQTASYGINLSGQSLGDKDFLGFVIEQLESHEIDPTCVCFEITETAAFSNLASTTSFITKLRALGCSFALDDFGSGFNSFAYLKAMPFEYLKIAGKFIKHIVTDKLDNATVEAINHIGQLMNMRTIAEFVDNEAVLARLRSLGVDYAQGYAIECPQPVETMLRG